MRLQPGLAGRFSRDGFFSEPGYLGFSDYDRAEYKAAGKVLDGRNKGKQITSTSDKSGAPSRFRWRPRVPAVGSSHPIGECTGFGLGESARTDDKKSRSKNATFGVFERLYAEAYKEPNYADKQWEKTVKSKVIGPQWRPSDGGKSRYTGGGASGESSIVAATALVHELMRMSRHVCDGQGWDFTETVD